MTAVSNAVPARPISADPLAARIRWTLRDALVICGRGLTQVRHQPGELVGALVFPALIVVMFGYVFGSAIVLPGGGNYREYLMPGLFAMGAVSSVMVVALQVSKDLELGVMDRFRSMPMSRLAVPLGRALEDLLQCIVVLAVMSGIGLLVGWRAHLGLGRTASAYGLILLLRFGLTLVGIAIGMSVKPKTADSLVPLFLPVSILSNGFVPTAGQPGWLRPITEWNPISALVQACRELFGNPGVIAGHAFPLEHPYLVTVAWAVVLIGVFAPITARRFSDARD